MTGFLGGASGKESIYQCRRHSVPGLGRSPGEGNDNPLQYSCLENPMDRGAWQATVHGVEKSWTQLNIWALGLNNRYKWTPVKRSFHQGLPWWSSGRPLCFQCRGHIWSLVRELRSHMPGDTEKKNKTRKSSPDLVIYPAETKRVQLRELQVSECRKLHREGSEVLWCPSYTLSNSFVEKRKMITFPLRMEVCEWRRALELFFRMAWAKGQGM